MRPRGRCAALLVLVIAAFLLLVASPAARAQPAAAPVLEIGEVRIRPGSISISAIVEIEIRNHSAVERRVCIGAFHLTMRPGGDSYAEGGALDCQSDGPFFTIPARGSHVIERSVLRRQEASGRLQISMLLFHAPTGERATPAAIDAAWEGSVREALR